MASDDHKKKQRPPIMDGGIQLAPGVGVTIDERLGVLWGKEIEKIRIIRGNVMAASIQTELGLDSLLNMLFYPWQLEVAKEADAVIKVEDLTQFFLYEVVKNWSFSNKLRMLKKLSQEHSLLAEKDCRYLLQQLDEVRKIRNLFAHSAITLVPTGESPNQVLHSEGFSDGKRVVINDEYVSRCEEFFSEATSALKSLRESLAKPKKS